MAFSDLKTLLDTNLKASNITEAIYYWDELGTAHTLQGVFTDEFTDELVEDKRPRAYIDASELVGTVHGTLWEINSQQYLARQVQFDGDGWATVVLEKQ